MHTAAQLLENLCNIIEMKGSAQLTFSIANWLVTFDTDKSEHGHQLVCFLLGAKWRLQYNVSVRPAYIRPYNS